jgi:uncharacterized protein YpmS
MKEKGKWVTKTNMWAWIILGIILVLFGICMGIWKDKKTIEKMVSTDVMNRLVDIITETYPAEQKIQNISQINELQEEDYAQYRVILQDKKATDEAKLDQFKRKVAYLYYLPSTTLDAPGKIQKVKALEFSKETSADIMEVLAKDGDAATKIDQMNTILKEDL